VPSCWVVTLHKEVKMKKALFVLMILMILTIPVKAQETDVSTDGATDAPMTDVVGEGDIIDTPVSDTKEADIVEPGKVMEVSADAKSLKAEKIIPTIIIDLLNVPDVEKVTDIAEEEAEDAGWGAYGGIFVLLIAAVIGIIRIRRKKKRTLV